MNSRREADLRRKYGISAADWDQMYGDGKCPLCLRRYTADPARLAALDHDHVTGLARGITCSSCNYDVGRRRDVGWYQRAAAYLQDPPASRLPGERRRAPGGPPSS